MVKIKLVAEIEGNDADIEFGFNEIKRLVLKRYIEGGDGNDDRRYHFTVKKEEKEEVKK